MDTVLGIDLGTQSMKLVCYEFASKKIVANVSSPLDVHREDDGTAEQSATDWLTALKDCCDQIPQGIKTSIQAIGVSGQQHGFVPLDAKGKVLAPVKLWCDTSTQQEVNDITEACGGLNGAIKLTGNPIVTGYTSPKVLWLKNNHPTLYERMDSILLPHDYLNFILTGVISMECGDASGTGFLDISARSWSREMIGAVDAERDIGKCLPTIVEHDQFIGKTSQDFSQKYGMPSGIPVSAGGGDNMMGAVGTGNVSPGKLTMSLGSSGTLYAYSDKPIIDPTGTIAAFCSSTGGWLPLLCTMNCTIGTELIRDLLDVSIEKFDSLISPISAGCNGLITLPYFNGERTPNLPNGKGCIVGLSPDNCSPGHLMRSTVEGATYALKYGVDELTALGIGADEIILTGGGSNSAEWRQIVADICQLPVSILDKEEGASFGAALQSLWVLQRQSNPKLSISDLTNEHLGRSNELSVKPNIKNTRVYERGFEQYQKTVNQISPLFQ